MRILLTDDEPSIRSNLKRLLGFEGHEVIEAEDGLQALAQMAAAPPDLVFSDVLMPGMDGYELCRRIKANPAWAMIPVIFVSGQDSIEARLEGFAAGGEDFIVKPFQSAEVIQKVASANRILSESRELRELAQSAQAVAMVAMKSAAESGVVLNFMKASIACATLDALAALLRRSVAEFGLDSVVQIKTAARSICISGKGHDVPLDISILNHVRLQGRIFEFQNRSVFNYDSVSLLVTDMPREDDERCGRLRDHLALLAEAADAKVRVLQLDADRQAKILGIAEALATARASIARISENQRIDEHKLSHGMVRLQQNLASVFVGCGLREAQEDSIVAVVKEHMEETLALIDHGRQEREELNRVTEILGGLAESSSGPG